MNRSKCFIKQYSDIVEPVTGLHLRGNQTLAEDIADNGAIKAAWAAYLSDKSQPIDRTRNMAFFYGFAQVCCATHKLRENWF